MRPNQPPLWWDNQLRPTPQPQWDNEPFPEPTAETTAPIMQENREYTIRDGMIYFGQDQVGINPSTNPTSPTRRQATYTPMNYYSEFMIKPTKPKTTRKDIHQWSIADNHDINTALRYIDTLAPNQLGIVDEMGHTEVLMNDNIDVEESLVMANYKLNEDTIEIKNFIDPTQEKRFIIAYTGDKGELRTFLRSCVSVYKQNYGDNYIINQGIEVRTNVPTVHGVNAPVEVVNSLLNTFSYMIDQSTKEANRYFKALVKAVTNKDIALFVQSIKNLSHLELDIKTNSNIAANLKSLVNKEITEILISESDILTNYIYNAFKTIYKINHANPSSTNVHFRISNLRKPDNNAAYLKEYTNFHAYYNNHRVSNLNTIYIRLFEEQAHKTPEEFNINLESLYPELKSHINKLMSNFNNYWNRTGIDFTWEGVRRGWEGFNRIKTDLMFLGFKELEAVEFILKESFNSNLNTLSCKGSHKPAVCEFTKQIVPECFIVPVTLKDGTTVNMNVYYIYTSNHAVARFDLRSHNITGKRYWYEYDLPSDSYYDQSMQNHTASAIAYLSPISCKGENTRVFQDGKTYTPVPYLGVELELERQKECKEAITEDILNSLGHDFVILKKDGSLSGHKPIEVVTVPATLAAHKERWEAFMADNALKKQLQSYTTGRCGMHVHISRDSMTGLQLAKYMRFINLKENRSFIEKLAQRGHVDFCRYTDYDNVNFRSPIDGKLVVHNPINTAFKNIYKSRNGANHYDAVNTSNPQTIEIRIFRGNMARGHFFKNIEFVHALWLYTRDCSMMQLDYKDFLFWLFKLNSNDYSNLMQWLVAAGYSVSNRSFTIFDKDREATKKEINQVRLIVNKKFNTKDGDTLRKLDKNTVLKKSDLLSNG